MKRVKVAVIGSGLAGLSTAYLLSKDQEQFEVHLFEKNTSLGMDASSISIGPEKEYRIDVPMRSFKSGYYSHLLKLYKHLGIQAKKTKFSFGWYRIKQNTDQQCATEGITSYTQNEPYLIYSGAKTIGYLNRIQSNTDSFKENLLSLLQFAWNSLVVAFSYFQILAISLYMHHAGHLHNPKHIITQLTLGEFFEAYYFHSFFAHKVFIPLFAAVCTNSYNSMLRYPASDILEYMALGLFEESYVASSGVQQVVECLSQPLQHVHLATQIKSIKKSHLNRYEITDDQGETHHVDHIVFATQGNQAAQLLDQLDTTQAQTEILREFEYDTALVINHTDTRLLPTDPSHWKTLNLAMMDRPAFKGELVIPYDTTMTTHILNMSHPIGKECIYMQTTNPCLHVDPKKILSVAWFERATVTLKSKRALQAMFVRDREDYALGPCQGKDGIWFVGSYCWKGIPLLEGCVASAEYVVTRGIGPAEGVDIKVPWSTQ